MTETGPKERPQKDVSGPPNFYGRRKGHKLRPARQVLVDTLLPRLRAGLRRPETVDVASLFDPPPPDLWMEIGFGAGEHLAHQACQHPEIGLIGVEPYVNGVAALLAIINANNLENIRLFDDDARLLLPRLPDGCLGRLFILFSDPWPKARHNRRRVFTTENLTEFARILRAGAVLRFASDDMSYVRQALDIVQKSPDFFWRPTRPSDWRDRPADALETRYEAKARSEGRSPAYLTFVRSGS
ncbi:MAG: tRNA (guanine(46)-N(7))-methyltransferase TrmB [Rhodospirillales bacterium]|nr:tRNA (guanine(46)-N(7))-methyltransferase TrmB [Rhodospirillales bacterium]